MADRTASTVVNVATAAASSVPVPSVVAPSMNVTVPVAVPAPGACTVTVAVNVTDWPNFDGFADEVTDVVVSAFWTSWSRVFDVLALKLASPP